MKEETALNPIDLNKYYLSNKQPKDIFDHLCLVSPQALILFNFIKEQTNSNLGTTSLLCYQHMDDEEYEEHMRLINELIEINLIRDLSPLTEILPIDFDSYMINPNMLRPKQYKEAVKYWNKVNS